MGCHCTSSQNANVHCPVSHPPFSGKDPEIANWPYERGPKEEARIADATLLMSNDLVIDYDDGHVVKFRNHAAKQSIKQMEPSEKIYGIHWETEMELPLWQLTMQDWLRVDITRDFDAKYRLVAYTPLLEETANALRARMTNTENDEYWEPTIESDCFGVTGSQFGSKRDIFKYIAPPDHPNPINTWRVSNCARISPGFMHWVSRKHRGTLTSGSTLDAALVHHPSEAYQVQFFGVPWGIFTNYWRKPIHLDRKFHYRGRSKWGKRYNSVYGLPAVDVLDFDMTLLKQKRCFFADFSGMYIEKKRTTDADLTNWMLKNSRAFRLLSDGDSPFVKDDTEFLFTVDWM